MTVKTEGEVKLGRPRKHLTKDEKRAANAAAARKYRAQKKAQREERRNTNKLPQSRIIDLSALNPPWRMRAIEPEIDPATITGHGP